MLLQSEKAVDPAELRRCLSIILCCGEILHILLNNLIDLRKLASGKFEVLGAMPLDPSAALRRAADACGPIAAEKSLRLSVDIAPGVPRFLTADAHCLHQILVNLLSNAVKFSPPGGEINLALRLESGPEQAPQQQQPQPQPQQPPPQPPAEPQPPPPGERVVFEVADHGIGISPERLQQLFGSSTVNPAFPSGAPLSAAAGLSEFGGAGIGLLVSRRLAELMGGVLTAQSDLGRGSRFLFSLPLSLPSAEQLSFLPSAPEEPLPGILEPVLRILVVEDNLLNQVRRDRSHTSFLLLLLLLPLPFSSLPSVCISDRRAESSSAYTREDGLHGGRRERWPAVPREAHARRL
jgi:signal transduction histidine kinase